MRNKYQFSIRVDFVSFLFTVASWKHYEVNAQVCGEFYPGLTGESESIVSVVSLVFNFYKPIYSARM